MTFENRTGNGSGNGNNGGLRADDPRLTAYAFGELEGEERALVEAALAADPALRAVLAELRAFGGELEDVLKTEAEPEAVRAGGRVLRFPTWVWAAAGLAAAACLAVMIGWREEARLAPEPELVARMEVIEPGMIEPVTVAVKEDESPVQIEPEQTVPEPVKWAQVEPLPTVVLEVVAPTSEQIEQQKEVRRLLAEGRSQYIAGDVDAAMMSFRYIEAFDEGNAEAKYFLGRIAEERARLGTIARVRMRAAMVEEVSKSWQRPGMYSERTSSGLGEVALEVGYRRNLAPSDMSSGIGESYAAIRETGFIAAATESLSTFSIDVDTASYANVRRFLRDGRLPPRDAVRIEELINYFPYRYAAPSARSEAPFAANLAVVSAPWAPEHRLVRIGIKGRELATETRPAANLVFLIDVSGSMNGPARLPLVKDSLRLLVGRLRPDDRVAIVTYAGSSGLALPSTPVAKAEEIIASLDRLEAGGSTNGGMGIHLAYDIAKANFRSDGINRVILCTDGDFNVGITSRDALLELVQEKARSRVYLTVLGFGMGNFKDGTLELLSNKGNGTYGYIDSAREARKVFVEQVEGTLATIAKDVKIQVEFNPARVASYRLIGYENRMLAKEDFNNDAVDAGDVGAGHTVTALYEIVPMGSFAEDGAARPAVDPLRYGPRRKPVPARATPDDEVANELLTVKIRYKAPDGDVSRMLEFPLVDRGAGFAAADAEFKFATAVAAWGMLLRESPHVGAATWADVLEWAQAGLGNDANGHRAEFIELVRKARALRTAWD